MANEQVFEHHIFCCLNERTEGHSRGSCKTSGAQPLFNYMKARVAELGLKGDGKVRMNKSGCLDQCECGPVMVIYPEGTWYAPRTNADVDELIESHLQGGQIVERLRLSKTDMIAAKVGENA